MLVIVTQEGSNYQTPDAEVIKANVLVVHRQQAVEVRPRTLNLTP